MVSLPSLFSIVKTSSSSFCLLTAVLASFDFDIVAGADIGLYESHSFYGQWITVYVLHR
jgi:hypothetical protein